MADDFNTQVINDFRANGGKVGEKFTGMPFSGAPMVLLTTTGARSGKQTTTPLMSLTEGDTIYIFASKGGAPTNPDWYHNILANPQATAEVGTEKFAVKATAVSREERDRVYAKQAGMYPNFAEYEKQTSRVIPVVKLERV